MLRTEKIDCPMLGMGKALLRMAERNGGATTDDALALFVSVLMKGLELAEETGSVCVGRDDLARLITEPEGSADEAIESESADATDYVEAAHVEEDEHFFTGTPDAEAYRAVDEGIDALETRGLLVRRRAADADVRVPFVYDTQSGEANARLYVARYFVEECRLAADLLEMVAADKETTLTAQALERVEAISHALNPDPEDKNDKQQEAVKKAMTNRLTVISGGPGTGKTTTVGLILECLLADMPADAAPLRVYLAAPTGKATGRMRQSIENLTTDAYLAPAFKELALANGRKPGARALIESRTIHKWLVTNTSAGRRPSRENPFDADVLIIDEASMIDVHLAAELFAAVGPKTRVIVLGDKYQLAAVGPGAVFADISRPEGGLSSVTVKLEKSRRFKSGSVIARLANAINHEGGMTDREAMKFIGASLSPLTLAERAKRLKESEEKVLQKLRDNEEKMARESAAKAGDGYFVAAYPDGTRRLGFSLTAKAWIDGHLSVYIEALLRYLREKSQANLEAVWKALMDFRPLCAQRHGPQSVTALNAYMIDEVKKVLQREGFLDEMSVGSSWPGAVVIVRQNDDMLGVYNGDVGVVLPVMKEGEERLMTIFGDSGLKEGEGLRIPPSLLPRHDAAFAMTIHQSQGSEFRHVAVFLPMKDDSPLATRELLYTGVTRTKASIAIFGRTSVLEKAVATATTRVSGLAARLDA